MSPSFTAVKYFLHDQQSIDKWYSKEETPIRPLFPDILVRFKK